MPYQPQLWADGDPTKPLSAARMTVIENALAAAQAAIDKLNGIAAPPTGGTGGTLIRNWFAGYSGGDISAAGQTNWTTAHFAPQVLGGYIDGKGGYTDGQNGFASAITAVGQNPLNVNQAYFAGSDAIPGHLVSLLTVGLIPHSVAFSTGAPVSAELARMISAASTDPAVNDTTHWQAFGAALVSGGWNHRNFVIRLGHEANGNSYPWATNSDSTTVQSNGNTRTQNFQLAFQHAVTAIRAGGATNVRFDFCMNARTGGTTAIANHYPGDSYVDIVSVDWYNFNDKTTVADLNADQSQFPNLVDVPAFANTHSKQFGVGEWGVHSASYNAVTPALRDQPAVVDWMFAILRGLNTTYANSTTYPYGFVSHDAYFDTSSTAFLPNASNTQGNPLTNARYNTVWNGTGAAPGSTAPGAPTIGTATGGVQAASVAFTPGTAGDSATDLYTAVSSPGAIQATGTSSPITVSGLTAGTAYTFTVFGHNATAGNGAPSASSNSITPTAPPVVTTTGTNLIPAVTADTSGGVGRFAASLPAGGTAPTLAVDTTVKRSGAQSLKLTAVAANRFNVFENTYINVTPGAAYSVLASVRLTAGGTVQLQVTWNNGFTYVSFAQSPTVTAAANTWVDLVLPVTVPATGVTKAYVQVNITSTPAIGDVVNVDQFELALGGTVNSWTDGA